MSATFPLINVYEEQNLVATIDEENNVSIFDNDLKRFMTETGIMIPPANKNFFDDKTVVKLTEKQFPIAFRDIFIKITIPDWNTKPYRKHYNVVK